MTFTKEKLPPRITEIEIVELLPIVRDLTHKDHEIARTRMIEGFIRLTAAITARYVVRYPHKAWELFSVGLLALVTAIDRVAKGLGCEKHDNIAAYVHKYVKYEILEFVKIDHIVRPPLNSPWLLKKLHTYGRNFLYNEFGCIPYIEDNPNDGDEENTESEGGRRFIMPPALLHKEQSNYDFTEVELLESEFFTSREKIILRLRLEGYNNARIGRAIGYTEARVGQLIAEMEKRVRKVIKGLV
jgi:DNA-directed RNA polymerase specialized sigma subunit